MMGHYDRAVCTTELRLRNDILQKIRGQEWEPTPAFQVPVEEAKVKLSQASTVAECSQPDPSDPETASDASDRTSLGADVGEDVSSEVDILDLYTNETFA